MVWLEVETKVKLKDSQVPDLRKRIKKIAKLKKRGKKIDDYFAVKQKIYPKKAFRIRNTTNHAEITFKKHLKHLWTKEVVVKQEFEFAIDGKDQKEDLLELFKDIGVTEWVQKVKMNETYKYKKNKTLSIEINHVKHLGYFMEMEYLCQKKDVKKAIKIIMDVLKELEINLKQVDNIGYTKRLWEKKKFGKRHFIG